MYIRGLVLPLSCLSFLSSSCNVLYYLSNTTLLPVSASSCLLPSAPSPSLAFIPVTQPCPRYLALGHLTSPLSGPARPRPTLRIPSPRSCMISRPVTSSLEPAPIPSRPVTVRVGKETDPRVSVRGMQTLVTRVRRATKRGGMNHEEDEDIEGAIKSPLDMCSSELT
jgi:hypothetical protein